MWLYTPRIYHRITIEGLKTYTYHRVKNDSDAIGISKEIRGVFLVNNNNKIWLFASLNTVFKIRRSHKLGCISQLKTSYKKLEKYIFYFFCAGKKKEKKKKIRITPL